MVFDFLMFLHKDIFIDDRKNLFCGSNLEFKKNIGECLQGISRKCIQESISYEVFVVDNGSSDGTIEIIKQNAGKIPISLICLPKNKGTTKPRNMALKRCTGDVICVLDSDAVLLEGNLRDILTTLKEDDTIDTYWDTSN